ncbi:MAG TPA: potassium channel family protein [Dehalococcoidia bacterium]|nr:potassium channel family protein [Dehalococcoidia bacterium]
MVILDVIAVAVGLALVALVLWDVFETIVLPRRVSRRVRPARIFYLSTWAAWTLVAGRLRGARRERYLSYFGPLSLLMLLVSWAIALIVGYALVQRGVETTFAHPAGISGFMADIYFSGTTFFTLGLGDVAPLGTAGRLFTVVEAGTGFGLLGLVVGYLPAFYQSLSRRETAITLLDARAGSPPSGLELIVRYAREGDIDGLARLLADWETWAAELLESHLSYPLLAFFRSQHDNQSWLAALTAVLDACSLVLSGIEGIPARPARLTFAIARHAAVDLCQVMVLQPCLDHADRLPPDQLANVCSALTAAGVPVRPDGEAVRKLAQLRGSYEPYVFALSDRLLMPLPPWIPPPTAKDDWIATAWKDLDGLEHF